MLLCTALFGVHRQRIQYRPLDRDPTARSTLPTPLARPIRSTPAMAHPADPRCGVPVGILGDDDRPKPDGPQQG